VKQEYDSSITWIPSGLASRILGVSINTLRIKYEGSIRNMQEPNSNIRWCLEDCQKLAQELMTR
jgi:hypothetical protein